MPQKTFDFRMHTFHTDSPLSNIFRIFVALLAEVEIFRYEVEENNQGV